MNFRKIIFSAAGLLLSLFGFAAGQNRIEIKGRVADAQTSEALPYCTVILYTADSTVAGGATTLEDGSFSVSAAAGSYSLNVSFMGYQPKSVEVSGSADLGTIALEPDAAFLQGAVISSHKKLIEVKLDKLVMNISESATTQGSNGREILRRAPGVYIDHEGNVTLNGQPVSVWVDGRPSNLSGKELEALLTATDGTTIDRIEIMAHPSAKYDAQGSGGIIDIKLKKNVLQGLSGSVKLNAGAMLHDGEWDYSTDDNINLSYRGAKSNTSLMVSPGYTSNTLSLLTTSEVDASGIRQESDSYFRYKGPEDMFRLSHDWYVNDRNIVGGIVSVYNDYSNGKSLPGSLTNTWINGVKAYTQTSDINHDSSDRNVTANLNWTHTINPMKAQEFTVNADYGYYDITKNNLQWSCYNEYLLEGAVPQDVEFVTDGLQYINMASIKADYQQVVFGKGMLETGVKFVTQNTDNKSDRKDFDFAAGEWVGNRPFSSDFDYTESVAAAYASLALQLTPQWVVKGGLRGEYTMTKGDWRSAGQQSDTTYFNLFPTLYVGYNPNENSRLGISATRRIQRAMYEQLNPQMSYYDASSALCGNPYLTPAYNTTVTLSYGYKSVFSATLLYQGVKNLIMQAPYHDGAIGNFIRWDNFGRQDYTGLVLSVPELEITKWWLLNATVIGAYNVAKDGDNYRDGQFMTQGNGSLTFLLPKEWQIVAGGTFNTGLTMGYMKVDPMLLSYASVKKNLWDAKGTLSFDFMDIFRSMKQNITTKANGIEYSINQYLGLQKASVTFTYRFGNMKPVRERKVGDMEEAARVGASSATGSDQ